MIFILIPCSMRLSAQGFSTTRIESTADMPLLIAQRAPAGQPIRFLAGSNGLVRALEIDATGGTWIRGPLSIGPLIGAAANERVRVGSIDAVSGKGMVLSLVGTTTSTGLLIRDVGLSGSEDAGMVIQSSSNGQGTGLRIGGPSNSTRPTLSTGIDITGGTGLRYNALTSGSGTAIDIGGTIPPRRGIEIVASGPLHIGLLSIANTSGAGVIGVSQSSSYTSVPPTERVGVRGHAATNSAVMSDTIIGTFGSSIRGGAGGTLTTSIGTLGQATSIASAHAGTAIGVLGRATALAPGRAIAIGGCFITDKTNLSLVALGGDVYLGSSDAARPPQLTASTMSGNDGQTKTHVFDLDASGFVSVSAFSIKGSVRRMLGPGTTNDLSTDLATVIRVDADVAASELTGCSGERRDRMLMILVTSGVLHILHENAGSQPEHRFHLNGGVDIVLETDETVMMWYDEEIARWRILSS
ncbi:MAG: hypothetical protein NTX15_03850 [Candidatus Kapabacteria bacterium]|nr:hypothetical protein [Candidatus Kapabacteria bacterium]